MKNLVLFFAVAAAVSFASCGTKTEEAAPAVDSSAVVEEVVVADSAAVVDSAVVEAAPAEVVAE
jgi:hypothetical protein